jgi:anaerobic selenocysteine-containing dehydrogenase
VACPLHNWRISLSTGEAMGEDKGCTPTIPVRVDAGRVLICRTTCPYCGVGCGVWRRRTARAARRSRAIPTIPANLGRLCSKGSALGETLGLGSRVLHPLKRNAARRL